MISNVAANHRPTAAATGSPSAPATSAFVPEFDQTSAKTTPSADDTGKTTITDPAAAITAHRLALVNITPDMLAEFEAYKQQAEQVVAVDGKDANTGEADAPPVGYSMILPGFDSGDWMTSTDEAGWTTHTLSASSQLMTRNALLKHAGENAEQAARSERILQSWLRNILGQSTPAGTTETAAST